VPQDREHGNTNWARPVPRGIGLSGRRSQALAGISGGRADARASACPNWSRRSATSAISSATCRHRDSMKPKPRLWRCISLRSSELDTPARANRDLLTGRRAIRSRADLDHAAHAPLHEFKSSARVSAGHTRTGLAHNIARQRQDRFICAGGSLVIANAIKIAADLAAEALGFYGIVAAETLASAALTTCPSSPAARGARG
jgi:hypothetical protein